MSRVALAPSRSDAPSGAPLMVIFHGETMTGAWRTGPSASVRAATGAAYRIGGNRSAAGAGQPTGGGAAPGGLPPVRARPARRPGTGERPADRPAPGRSPPRLMTQHAR